MPRVVSSGAEGICWTGLFPVSTDLRLLPVVVVLILLPTIAFASPPDPSWIAGIFDGADGDDIVVLIYEIAAADAPAVADMSLLPRLAKMSLESVPQGVRGHHFTRGARAPPALRSTRPTLLFRSSPKNTPTASRTESLVNVLLAVPRSVPSFPLDRIVHSPPTEEERGPMTTLRSLLVVTCLSLIGCSTTSSAPSANMPPSVDVTGKWSGTYTWPYGVSPMTLVLQQAGGEVTGEILTTGSVGETRQGGGPVKGTVSDDAVALTYASGTANLTVKGDRMSGVSSVGSNWSLQRQR